MQTLLQHSVEQSADRHPDTEAFRFQSNACTYEYLARITNRLARVLSDQGVRRGDRVGIYCQKSLHSAYAIYGIFKAGAAYVPIDPGLPVGRVNQIIDDCGIRHIVTHPPKQKDVGKLLSIASNVDTVIGLSDTPESMPPHVRIVSWPDIDSVSDSAVPVHNVTDRDLAYIIFTSGSTGSPKGIMHSHYSGLSYAQRSAALYGLCSDDRLGNHSPLHFDMSTLDYLSSTLVGATTVIIPEAFTKLPASLSQLIDDEKLTIWYSVPFALIQLLLRGVLDQRDLSSLRWVLFGGEPFPPGYLKALMTRLSQARFSNVYGPAEVNQCMYYHVPDSFADRELQVPIGHLCDSCGARIVDEADQEVVPGTVGELLIKSPNMMDGYWQRSDLNQHCFYIKPGDSESTERYYRTGDLAAVNPAGEFIYHGRKDRQVKVRGNRIELDEVEAVFSAIDGVEQAAAYPTNSMDAYLGDPTGMSCTGIEVVLIPTRGETLDPQELRAVASRNLPAYAVPANIKITSQFPRTTSGKIDRKALQETSSINKQAASASMNLHRRV